MPKKLYFGAILDQGVVSDYIATFEHKEICAFEAKFLDDYHGGVLDDDLPDHMDKLYCEGTEIVFSEKEIEE